MNTLERLEYLKAMKARHENNMKLYQRKVLTFAKMKEHITHVIEKIEKQDFLDKGELEKFFDLVIEMDRSSENGDK